MEKTPATTCFSHKRSDWHLRHASTQTRHSHLRDALTNCHQTCPCRSCLSTQQIKPHICADVYKW